MAQRLVRRLEDSTKQPYTPDGQTLALLQQLIDTLPENLERPSLDGLQLYKPGSSKENPYGYSGQLAIREQFMMTGELAQVLTQSNGQLTTEVVENAAIKSGMRTMRQDGILKAIAGETTLEEIFRVLG
jgi:type II secretory ATPase GspE/PulE/Tfp pilus assembly ATPase PilB-like protein